MKTMVDENSDLIEACEQCGNEKSAHKKRQDGICLIKVDQSDKSE